MKNLIKTVLALGMVCGFAANAHEENEKLCYPLVHGENGLGSRNSMFLPSLIVQYNHWYSNIYITNASNYPINVKLDLLNYDASIYNPYDVLYIGEFDEENSPLNLDAGGAILKPHQTGVVSIRDDNQDHRSGLIGKIHWQADRCLDKALRVDIRTTNSASSHYSQGFVTLNGGNPF